MASLALPTSTTERKPSPPTKGIGFEVWSEVQRRRSKDVTHASFMVDGLELMLLGIAGMIGWVLLGPFTFGPPPSSPPPPPPPPPVSDCQELRNVYNLALSRGFAAQAEQVLQAAADGGCSWALEILASRPAPVAPVLRISGGFGGKSGGGPLIQAALGGMAAAPPVAPTTAATRPGGSSALIV